jgi:hypothetical protein
VSLPQLLVVHRYSHFTYQLQQTYVPHSIHLSPWPLSLYYKHVESFLNCRVGTEFQNADPPSRLDHVWSGRWGEIMSLKCGHQRAYSSINQAIHEHGEPWWNDIDRGKLIRPPELSGNPTRSHLVARRGTGEENKFCLAKYFCSYFSRGFYMP